MYLLDTDTLSHLWQGNQSVKERLLEVEDTEIGITVITKCDVQHFRQIPDLAIENWVA